MRFVLLFLEGRGMAFYKGNMMMMIVKEDTVSFAGPVLVLIIMVTFALYKYNFNSPYMNFSTYCF